MFPNVLWKSVMMHGFHITEVNNTGGILNSGGRAEKVLWKSIFNPQFQ